jgi:hypothetical protein
MYSDNCRKWEGTWKEAAVADFEVLYGHLLGRLRESTEILIPSLYLNPKHPEFEAGESATGPRCSGVGRAIT